VKTHSLAYDHGDGRAGTRCGIELRKHDNGDYRGKTNRPLSRVNPTWDNPVKVVAFGTEDCGRCLKAKAHQPLRKRF
jgi:hypothetical protein